MASWLSLPCLCNFKSRRNVAAESIRREILKGFRTSETLEDFICDKISMPRSGGFFSNKDYGSFDRIQPAPRLPWPVLRKRQAILR